MKRLFTTFFLLTFIAGLTQAQVVINEIMYNSPDAGQDSTEYIELFNNSGATIDITGWSFTEGVTHTFSSGTIIGANGFLLIAGDAQAMMDAYGVVAIQWESGGLNNGGETIMLTDLGGNEIDMVTYDDGLPWPGEPDGNGPSLELCSPGNDNTNPANWFPSTNPTGAIFEGVEVLATPGAPNTASCPPADAMVEISSNAITPANVTIFVGQTVEWNNISGVNNINGTLAAFPNNPEGFGNGAPSGDLFSFTFTFTIAGNYEYQSDTQTGVVGTVTVLPVPPNDIVISEIMYNIPGAGNEFDFIELTNRSNQVVDLEGYTFSMGVEFTFPATMIQPGEYLSLIHI